MQPILEYRITSSVVADMRSEAIEFVSKYFEKSEAQNIWESILDITQESAQSYMTRVDGRLQLLKIDIATFGKTMKECARRIEISLPDDEAFFQEAVQFLSRMILAEHEYQDQGSYGNVARDVGVAPWPVPRNNN